MKHGMDLARTIIVQTFHHRRAYASRGDAPEGGQDFARRGRMQKTDDTMRSGLGYPGLSVIFSPVRFTTGAAIQGQTQTALGEFCEQKYQDQFPRPAQKSTFPTRSGTARNGQSNVRASAFT